MKPWMIKCPKCNEISYLHEDTLARKLRVAILTLLETNKVITQTIIKNKLTEIDPYFNNPKIKINERYIDYILQQITQPCDKCQNTQSTSRITLLR